MSESRATLIEAALAGFFNNARLADAKIFLGAVELPAHSVVLAAQSGYFNTAFKETFVEGSTKEFSYTEGSMHAYWRVFEYIYTGTYSEDHTHEALEGPDDDELAKDVRVYVLADYFSVEGLKDYALERFKSKAQKLWVSENFVDCIRDVYESTQDLEFREVVLGVAYEHLPDLWSKKPFRDLIHEGGDLAVALMGKIIKPEKAGKGRYM